MSTHGWGEAGGGTKALKALKKNNLNIEYLYALFTAFTLGLKLSQPLIGSKIPAAQMRNLKQTAVKVIYLQRSMIPAELKGEQDYRRILKYL